jgi:hypothetical protein
MFCHLRPSNAIMSQLGYYVLDALKVHWVKILTFD